MTMKLQSILSHLQRNGIQLHQLVDALNEACDPHKPVVCITHCDSCQIEFLCSHARLRMNKKRGYLMLCSGCKAEHDRVNVVHRVQRHRKHRMQKSPIDEAACRLALIQAKKDKGKLTAQSYSAWQNENPTYPTFEEIERAFGNWKQAKKQCREINDTESEASSERGGTFMINLSKEDAIFFLDVIDSMYSPNHVPKLHKQAPLSKLVKDRDSAEYQRFHQIATSLLPLLPRQKEIFVLESRWGLNGEVHTLEQVATQMGLKGKETVRTYQKSAERKIAKQLNDYFQLKFQLKKEEETKTDEEEEWSYRGYWR
ncbi:hypothetical protein P9G84_31775 [Brevibacillus centrosporus]|uniref:hypothetical protein n=1 Tax=Brevibacillus centrosporus TaxID=54910 RepID=UPI0011442839|nr:hypothetical protein [Brevibacillus centrosporus]MEC2133435.1 hypothetical protein [Brevibacillus centrosporus]